ncbi:hypothetical protein [Bifidobacterium avesanii]|uniref:DUF2975 domain-containing protein n=1 Tax=Bifidobacterium avesanii TaxID=1798157 RepID=A0A7K3TH47_9BIFI|nr:hypothetical protein [Bifidobacterium avesanii]KAB8287137.1 hypothetical protein DSM100685_1960 [Bifidobacterium avesanii]NEG77940.1 hypothetical protein [Bifidobacterium avesanii]
MNDTIKSGKIERGKRNFTRLNGIVHWASVLIEAVCWIGAALCAVMLALIVMAGGAADRMPGVGYGRAVGAGSFSVGVGDTVGGFTFALPDPSADAQYRSQLSVVDCSPTADTINGMAADAYRTMIRQQAEARSANPAALLTLIVLQIACMVAMALVMRNIRRVSRGIQAWLDRSDLFSPFEAGLAAPLRRIGRLLIAVPVAAGAGSVLALVLSALTGRSNLNVTPQLSVIGTYLMVGALALLVAHVFDYGGELQRDVDGLL